VKEVKTLVLVLAIDQEPWLDIEREGQDSTWKLRKPDSVTVLRYVSRDYKNFLFYLSQIHWTMRFLMKLRPEENSKMKGYGVLWNRYLNKKQPKVTANEETLTVELPEAYSLIGLKTRAVFEYIMKNYEFDFLYRTNVSSYLDLMGLERYVQTLQNSKDFYGGVIGESHGIKFASGSGYLMARETLSQALKNASQWNHFEIDDVAIGILMSQDLGKIITPINRKDFDSANFTVTDDLTFHYRCKAKDPHDSIKIMKSLHEKIISLD